MHIHAPKPPHSWSDLFREVGVIVVGILLALGAEQVIEVLRWREQVAVADEGIKAELKVDLMNAYERLIVDPCLRGQIRLLGTRLRGQGTHWTAAPVALHGSALAGELPRVYSAPSRAYTDDIWKNAVSADIISHMAPDHVAFLSTQYHEADALERFQDAEADAASRLTVLGGDAELSSDARVALLGNLGDVDYTNALMVNIARDILDNQRKARHHFDKGSVERDRRELLHHDRALRGSCVADLPLDLG